MLVERVRSQPARGSMQYDHEWMRFISLLLVEGSRQAGILIRKVYWD